MSNVKHECVTCGHRWESPDPKMAKKVRTAAKVNRQGPFCGLCLHLEMAKRFAKAQGYPSLNVALAKWQELTDSTPNLHEVI